jgi:hypothetical protein
MEPPHEQGDYDRLKEELRRMRRPMAPWYLEGELHQRIHSRRQRFRPLGVAPTLILITTLLTFAIVIYVTILNPLLITGEGATQIATPVVNPDSSSRDDSSHAMPTRPASLPAVTAAEPPVEQPRPQTALSARISAVRDSVRRDSVARAGRILPSAGETADSAVADTTRQ